MKFLLSDWRDILRAAWSVRLLFVSALCSALSAALGFVAPASASAPVAGGVAFGVALLGLLARITSQAAIQQGLAAFWAREDGFIDLSFLRRWFAPTKLKVTLSVAAMVAGSSLSLVAKWEGLETTAYVDIAGVTTVCYGETKGVRIGDTYTPEECRSMLKGELEEYASALNKCIDLEALPEGMGRALVSWSYNVGTGAACKSTLRRKVIEGDLMGACAELSKWNKARVNGKLQEVRGLTRRRAEERAICEGAVRDAGLE